MTTTEPVVTTTRDHLGQITIQWPEGHPTPDHVYACTGEFLQGAVEAHNRDHAGADPAPRDPATLPTPGQLWHQLLNAGPDERTGILTRLITNTSAAADCFAHGHTSQITHLQQALSALAHGHPS